jgi:ribonucleoside-triphosphate reductase (thioredoxin)
MNKSIKAMSDYTFVSRYARYDSEKKRRRTWSETVEVVKNMHLQKYPMAKDDIEWAFEQVEKKRVLGSQRALQYGGTPILIKNARLYNCTASYCDRPRFFQEALWLLLAGAGCGVSMQKHHIAKLPKVQKRKKEEVTFVIPDSIEGWADALGVLLSSYFIENQPFPEYFDKTVIFDYSKIRPKGSPLSSGVGKAPGSEGLNLALIRIELLLEVITNGKGVPVQLKPINAYDILMHASDAVLSGGVRRSSCAILFSKDDEEMMKAKTGDWLSTNPQRGRSNNSVMLLRNAITFDEFKIIMENVKQFGEPGFIWTDDLEYLINPCGEIGMMAYETFPLENGDIKRHANGEPVTGKSGWQFCNLSEINGGKIKSEEDFEIAAKAGAIIGTLQAGYTNFEYLGEVSENIAKQEALIGVSITGMMENPDIIFDTAVQRKMAKIILKENEKIAKLIGIKTAARSVCAKPSGSTSLLLGTSSGIHPHHSRRYFRRIQSNKSEPVLQWFKKHNPRAVEESVWSANKTDEILTFCVEVEKNARTKVDVNALTLLEHVKSTQKNWVMEGIRPERCTAEWLRHNISNTIHVKDDEWEEVTKYIYKNKEFFTGISLISIHGDKDYPQAPNCRVYTAEEILEIYGSGALLASGLIVDGLHCFEDLFKACSCALDIGEPLQVEHLKKVIQTNKKQYESEGLTAETKSNLLEGWLMLNIDKLKEKRDWVRRAKQFAKRYFDNDMRKMTYCLKDVNNIKLWLDLNREYVEVDYTQLEELTDETKIQETVACGGGACELHI